MINFFHLSEYLQYSIVFVSFIIVIVDIFCLMSAISLKVKKKYYVLDTLLLIFSVSLLMILVSGNYGYRKGDNNYEIFISFCNKGLPYILWGIILLTAVTLLSLYSMMSWKRKYISPASVKQAMDSLPAGLCYHNSEGVVKLVNNKMQELCQNIIGEPLFDACEFWKRLSQGNVVYGNTVEKAGDNPVITIYDGSTFSFTKSERIIAAEKAFELRATDITRLFSLNRELREYNNELTSLNSRLQTYGENVWDITREREILSAKVSIHDMLGKALLITKRYIENDSTYISKQELIDTWRSTVYLFDGGFAEKNDEKGLDELFNAAKIMGVKLKIEGRIPKDNEVLRFIMGGARECLTNAVHHAKAKELVVRLSYRYGFAVIEYTNDGKSPETSVAEGGGLSSLRQRVEGVGGIMEVESFPEFVLRLKIPSKEV